MSHLVSGCFGRLYFHQGLFKFWAHETFIFELEPRPTPPFSLSFENDRALKALRDHREWRTSSTLKIT